MSRIRSIIWNKSLALKRRLSSHRGFTLTELLACTIIMILAGGLILNTLDLAIKQFQEQTLASNARILCEDLSLAVQDKLAYVTKREGTDMFYSTSGGMDEVPFKILTGKYNSASSFETGESYGEVAMAYKLPGSDSFNYYRLISTAAYGKKLAANYNYEIVGDSFKVVIDVIDKDNNKHLANNTFNIKPIKKGVL